MNGMNPSGIEPLEYNCVVLPAKVEERTKGGLIRPDELREREQWAEIQGTLIAAAPAAFDDFGAKPNLGDTVIHARHAGAMVRGRDGVEYRVCKDKDIVAVMRHE